jgi:hypothetical protein
MTDSKALKPVLDLEKASAIYNLLDSDNEGERINAFNKLSALLRKAGITFADFRQIGLEQNKDDLRKLYALMKAQQADALVKLGQQRAEFFCNDAVYATVMVHGHRTNYPVTSTAFKKWLRYEYFRELEIAVDPGAIKTAIEQLAANAEFGDGTPQHRMQLRTAAVDGHIYIDLCNDQQQCIEVNENGWRVIEAPSEVPFRRTPGMRALPVPPRGGSIDMLRQFVNLTDKDFVLFVAVLLDAFRQGKHPILNLVGEQATAKSTLAKIFKKLTDPDETELRSLPGTIRDMFIAVDNARVRAWDNISRITPTISNALCELSDGSGFGIRKLYTDSDEYTVQGSRSIILTGLTNCVTRPDLNSRIVLLTLLPIEAEARRSEVELWKSFDEAYPLILGALLDALVHGLKTLPSIKLDKLDRLVDFQLFGHACEGAYAPAGSFAAAFAANKMELNEAIIEDDPVATAIVVFMEKRSVWSGTTTELMLELQVHDRTEAQVSKQNDWPKSASRFSMRLQAVAAPLRKASIEVTSWKASDRTKTRMIKLTSDASDASKTQSRSKRKGKPGRQGKPSSKLTKGKKKMRPMRPMRPNVRSKKRRQT